MDALPDEQAEDDFAEAMFIVRLKLEKADLYRFLPHRTDHGRLDPDGISIRGRSDHEFEKGAGRQRLRGFNRAAAHGDFRDPIGGPPSILREHVGVK